MEVKSKYHFDVFRFFNDIVLLSVGFVATYLFLKYQFRTIQVLPNIWLLLYLIGGWYLSSLHNKLYTTSRTATLLNSLLKTAKNIFYQFFFVILYFFSVSQTYNSRGFLIIYISLISVLLPLEKVLYIRIMLFLRNKGVNKKKILIVGAGKSGMEFFNIITKNKYLGYEVVGFLDDEKKTYLNGHYLGNLEKIDDFISNNMSEIDEVVVALPNHAHRKIKHIAETVSNYAVKLSIIPAYHDLINSQYNISIFSGVPMITLRNEPLDDIHLRTLKRLFDVLFSVFTLIFFCSWLFPIIALLVKLDSKGPIFFVQERWGRKNKKISCYKFRSMYTSSKDVDETDGKYNQAKKNDSRITRVGAFLRKTNLDEIPQFLNVLLGNMSVVGPRPHPTPLNLESKEVIDNYLVRHLVKPGITGWAQVNGFRGETSEPSLMRGRVNYDIWYIENWSLFLDLKIIFLTVWKTVAGDKNAF